MGRLVESLKLQGWESRLSAAIAAAEARPFAWGTHDCCMFACDVVRELTDLDIVANFRGRYTSRLGAFRVMREHSGSGRVDTIADDVHQNAGAWWGDREIPPPFAQRGDVVLVQVDDGPALAICAGEHAVVAAQPAGLTRIPLAEATRAWRV